MLECFSLFEQKISDAAHIVSRIKPHVILD